MDACISTLGPTIPPRFKKSSKKLSENPLSLNTPSAADVKAAERRPTKFQ
jgi:hypothetical protein